ncbi:MAG: MBL fold metallo-hydrolase RNA specificity domain-containing protein [Flavobacteriales bacterium]
MSKIKVHFLGAAGTVTGSKYLIETESKKVLIDCGLFQGVKKIRQLNWEFLPINAEEIDCVLLTHAHMDHTGYLPRLIDMGFRKKIYGTAPTLEIAEIILRDSAKIQEEDAERANKQHFTKHHPAKALYTVADVEKTVPHFKAVDTDTMIDLGDGVSARFSYVGHILGATCIELFINGKTLVFSGDVGRQEDYMMFPPQAPSLADVLFIESTYGDRMHAKENIEEHLEKVVNETIAAGGTLIIPSFAVERTQTLMYLLWQLKAKKLIPEVMMVMDSPMGADVLKVFQHHLKWQKLSAKECVAMCTSFTYTQDYKESLQIIHNPSPKIIIAGAGMLNGGRVLSYLQEYISKPSTTILMAGYMAEGTRGRQLLRGAQEIKVYGRYYEVKARIEEIRGLSGHADQQGLLDWMSHIKNTPQKVFIIHGEAQAADVLRTKIESTLGWNCEIPALWDIVEI